MLSKVPAYSDFKTFRDLDLHHPWGLLGCLLFTVFFATYIGKHIYASMWNFIWCCCL